MTKDGFHRRIIFHLRPLVVLYNLFMAPLAVYGIIILAKMSNSSNSLIGILSIFGLLAIVILFFTGRRWIMVKDQQIAQRSRDKQALHFYNQLIDINNIKEKRPYTFYLRPFTCTSHVRIPLKSFIYKRSIIAGPTMGVYDPELGINTRFKRYVTFGDFETELAKLVAKSVPLIALGRVGEQIGAGRVESSDEDWQVKFKLLSKHATFIFLIPSIHEGTKWEMNFILNESELLPKTFFFIPPDDSILGLEVGPLLEIGAGKGKIGAFNLKKDAIAGLALIGVPEGKIKKLENLASGALVQFSDRNTIKLFHALKITKSPSFSPFSYGSNIHLDFADFQQTIEEIMEAGNKLK